ncbi:FtsX-like permease family protein [Actinomadura litoris]|uniref:FtsX-like permease family protein n=1 Tax=Actinomadura litoris TaxID=2678616 RepID=UPI001FA6D95F|nr:FtsX-like permease family protein [Actinomadura litoris]
MRGYLPVLRMARRDALRAKGRTALVTCMIGLPVAVIVAVAVLVPTMEWSQREALPYELGTADARLTGTGHAPLRQDPLEPALGYSYAPPAKDTPWTTEEITRRVKAVYGPGARVQPYAQGRALELRTPRGYREAQLTELDIRDPMTRGMYDLVEGRAPAAADEIALSPSLAGREFPVGATARVGRDGAARRVVGHVRDPRDLDRPVALALPGASPGAPPGAEQEWLVSAGRPVTWADVGEFNKTGIGVLSREVVRHPPHVSAATGDSDVAGDGAWLAITAMVVAMIVLEIVLLAGPAFAVGIRRQRRMLALVAVAGGGARHLRAVVLASGLVIGGAAALAGAALGIAAAVAARPVAKAVEHTVMGPLEVPWTLVALTMALGAGSGLLAAYVPARQAARLDVVAALAGRRDRTPARRGWPIAGGVAAGAGVVLCLAGAGPLHEFGPALGAVCIIVGLVMAGPWLVGTAGRFAGRLPVPLRLAVRDSARNRGRSAPVVAAIMAAVAGITALAIADASDLRQEREEYLAQMPMGSALVRPPLDRTDAARGAVARELPGVPLIDVRVLPGENSACPGGETADCPSVGFSSNGAGRAARMFYLDSVVGGAREARLLLGRDDPAVARALAEGKVVLFGAGSPADGTTTATVSVWKDDRQHVLRKVRLPAVGVAADPHVPALVPPSLAPKVGVPARVEGFGVDRADHRVSEAEEGRLREVVAGFGERQGQGGVYVERGFNRSNTGLMVLLAVAGGALALGGSLIATGLSAADSRPDLATLAAVGARPRTRRLLMMGQAGFVAALGCWLGLAAGIVPGVAVARPLTEVPQGDGNLTPHGTIVEIPWGILLLIGVAVPLAAMAAAGLLTRSRLPMSHRLAG